MNRRHGRFPVLRALLSGALAVGACGHAEDPTNVSVTIDPTVSHQTLVGFGAATAYQAYLLSDRTDDIYQVLFVDSGLDILRLGNWYQNQSSTSTTPDTPFSDSASVQIVQKATAARGGTPPKILMSAWTPPAYLKSNGVTTAAPRRIGPDLSGGHADRERGRLRILRIRGLVGSLAAGLRGSRAWCRTTSASRTSPTIYTPYWETCLFGASEGASMNGIAVAGYGQALDAVYRAIQASDLATRPVLLGPETTGFLGGVVERYMAGLDLEQLGGIAHHLYGSTADNPAPDWFNGSMSTVGAAAAGVGLPAFMTEYSPNSPTMFDTAWLMNNALTLENVSAYIYWELVWNPTPPTGLVTIASPSPSSPYTINDTYYALKHFARWTDPGWVRVDATSSSLRGARVRVREPRRRQSHAGAPQRRWEGPPGGGEPERVLLWFAGGLSQLGRQRTDRPGRA